MLSGNGLINYVQLPFLLLLYAIICCAFQIPSTTHTHTHTRCNLSLIWRYLSIIQFLGNGQKIDLENSLQFSGFYDGRPSIDARLFRFLPNVINMRNVLMRRNIPTVLHGIKNQKAAFIRKIVLKSL
jgi:hypothetical protein